MTTYLTNPLLFPQDTTLQINELEYKMARRLKASEVQMDAYRKYEAKLERKKSSALDTTTQSEPLIT